jgi:hypothetical protein
MQPTISMKKRKLLQYADNVFFGGGVYQISLALLNFGHLFLSIFAERCHFFFTCFIRVIE